MKVPQYPSRKISPYIKNYETLEKDILNLSSDEIDLIEQTILKYNDLIKKIRKEKDILVKEFEDDLVSKLKEVHSDSFTQRGTLKAHGKKIIKDYSLAIGASSHPPDISMRYIDIDGTKFDLSGMSYQKLSQRVNATKSRLDEINKNEKLKENIYKKSLELAITKYPNLKNLDKVELIAKVQKLEEESFLKSNYPVGTEMEYCGCDNCSTWYVGDNRCSCDNCKVSIEVQGDVFTGFYAYAM